MRSLRGVIGSVSMRSPRWCGTVDLFQRVWIGAAVGLAGLLGALLGTWVYLSVSALGIALAPSLHLAVAEGQPEHS